MKITRSTGEKTEEGNNWKRKRKHCIKCTRLTSSSAVVTWRQGLTTLVISKKTISSISIMFLTARMCRLHILKKKCLLLWLLL